ncbi:L,D-transpeptidase family protein [Streptomyces sp. YIM 130001]|uniref:L,D-transpeptidase family protein n=1 Tax=Streptomyces sp. YIM 130001 TaxID=2259644 RepID=UPI000E65B5F4|nr:L,D-transpeptidase family protein [Streptomyces sp. YIM 130001]
MRISGSTARRTWTATAGGLACLLALTSCGGSADGGSKDSGASRASAKSASPSPGPSTQLRSIPGIGDRLHDRIPASARQVVAVYGKGEDSAKSTVVLYTKHGKTWDRDRTWQGHNGKKGWSTNHREGDNRSPVGVFTLTDAGGVLADPDSGSGLPYTRSESFAAPRYWAKSHWHDFDLVIAIDYNRVKGTPPNDPTRPQGQSKGGSIWLHMDHGSGTSGCVSLSRSAMEYLLRTLDPGQKPVVVMGDKAQLSRA